MIEAVPVAPPGNWATALRARLPAWFRLSGGECAARIVQALPLGPGARLLVVEFGGRRLLVGQSRAGLARLAEAPPSEMPGPASPA